MFNSILNYFSLNLGYLYLTPRHHHTSNEYSPYKVKVVSFSNICQNNYYTISARGVTWVRDGEQEFTQINMWIQEYR